MADTVKVHLFLAYLRGSLRENEYDLLHESLQEGKWEREWEQALDIFEAEQGETPELPIFDDLRQQALWQRINRSIASPVRTLWRQYRRMAAAAAIFIALGLFVYIQNASENPRSEVQTADVAAGRNRAVLKLSNGKLLDLESAASATVVSQTGHAAYKPDSGVLDYSRSTAGPIQTQTLEIPRGGSYRLILPDGTKVWLNAASSITFPSNFSQAAVREVSLSGEAYFEVFRNARQPFIVKTARQQVRVLGTHFNVTAYPEEQTERTSLIEGRVQVSRNGRKEQLRPGEQAIVSQQGLQVSEADAAAAADWAQGDFNFNQDDLRTAMAKIARWYDVEIVYRDEPAGDVLPGGWISRSSKLSVVLKRIEAAGNIHFQVQGRKVIVSR